MLGALELSRITLLDLLVPGLDLLEVSLQHALPLLLVNFSLLLSFFELLIDNDHVFSVELLKLSNVELEVARVI